MKFTRKTIRQAFDASIEELFDEFEEVPVASGSIGQVYRARLSAQGARNTGIDAGALPAAHCPVSLVWCVVLCSSQ
jgi:aarF domain-containing kinase